MGLATAVNRLRDSKAKSKVIILITDGSNNAGNIDPVTAAELAHTFGIKVYTICIGRGGLVPFPVNDPLFGKRYVKMASDVDDATLKKIADLTGGLYFRATSAEALKEMFGPGETKKVAIRADYLDRAKSLPFLSFDDGAKDDDSLDGKTVAELRELAEADEIDIGDATKKADIIAAIELAREG